MADKFVPKIPPIFLCNLCDYNTSSKKDYDKHLSTGKHFRLTHGLHLADVLSPNHKFICDCGVEYKHRQSLWKHRQICEVKKIPKIPTPEPVTEVKVLTELVKDVVKQNQELTNKIVNICQTGQTNTINNTISNSNIHSNNKTFNLQIFLNDTCKDAMNMDEFVDSIQFQLKDLEHVGEKGFVEGISDIIIDNLRNLDIRRPIHCSDNKREIIYIKDNNQWIKDDISNPKMISIIKQIANKNIKKIPEWVKNNPNCFKSDSKYNDKYLKIVSNSMSGGTELEQKTNINKIISRIAKEVTINKHKNKR
jgi:hypothetical protein